MLQIQPYLAQLVTALSMVILFWFDSADVIIALLVMSKV